MTYVDRSGGSQPFLFLEVAMPAPGIAVITMDRPPVNAVTVPMYDEIGNLFRNIEIHAPGARVAVLTGRGPHFCGGNDLDEFRTMTPANAAERMWHVRQAFWSIYDCDLPVVAAVHGVAVGTGLAIAGSCDLVVASHDARFGLPEIQVGAMGGAKHASRLVPQGVVRRMHLTADLIPARELAAYGGIAALAEPAQLLDEAVRLSERVARHSTVAIKAAKRSLNQIEYMNLEAGYRFEQGLTRELSGHRDAKEAVAAFFEQRAPEYNDR